MAHSYVTIGALNLDIEKDSVVGWDKTNCQKKGEKEKWNCIITLGFDSWDSKGISGDPLSSFNTFFI